MLATKHNTHNYLCFNRLSSKASVRITIIKQPVHMGPLYHVTALCLDGLKWVTPNTGRCGLLPYRGPSARRLTSLHPYRSYNRFMTAGTSAGAYASLACAAAIARDAFGGLVASSGGAAAPGAAASAAAAAAAATVDWPDLAMRTAAGLAAGGAGSEQVLQALQVRTRKQ